MTDQLPSVLIIDDVNIPDPSAPGLMQADARPCQKCCLAMTVFLGAGNHCFCSCLDTFSHCAHSCNWGAAVMYAILSLAPLEVQVRCLKAVQIHQILLAWPV